jgi:hypothetical protein
LCAHLKEIIILKTPTARKCTFMPKINHAKEIICRAQAQKGSFSLFFLH